MHTDKAAIGLSFLCALHCLALPLAFALFPGVAVSHLSSEAFHLWMVFAVVPLSAYALTLGCDQHKKTYLLGLGFVGLACLILAVVLGESFLGEIGEKSLTLIGAAIVSYGHYKNYRLCRQRDRCECL